MRSGQVPPHFFAISLTSASIMFVLAMLLKWKPLRRVEFLIPWMLLISGVGFAAAFLNGWIHKLAGMVTSIPVFGPVLMFVAAVVLVYIVAYDFWPRHTSNTTTEVSAVLMPSFAPYLGGFVGAGVSQFLGWCATAGATALVSAFGRL
jgi:hypothetical protein